MKCRKIFFQNVITDRPHRLEAGVMVGPLWSAQRSAQCLSISLSRPFWAWLRLLDSTVFEFYHETVPIGIPAAGPVCLAGCSSMLQCVAVCFSVLQCVAVWGKRWILSSCSLHRFGLDLSSTIAESFANWCERCLLITESPKTPGHYRYLIWVLCYIPYTGLAVFSFCDFSCSCVYCDFDSLRIRVLNA